MIEKKKARKKPRVRNKAVHVSLTEEEHAEFHAICNAHRLLERELVMAAVRAYKTVPQQLELLWAQVRVLVEQVRVLASARGGDAPDRGC